MFSKFRQCITSCFNERNSYGVTTGEGRRPSVEGAPSEDNRVPESVLTGFRAQNQNMDISCYSEDANDVPKGVGYQQDGTSHLASRAPSKTDEISDDVFRMRWAHHQNLHLPVCPSRSHLNSDISKFGISHINEPSHDASGAPMTSSKATSSCIKEYSGDSAYNHELEPTEKAAEHVDTDTGLKVQKTVEETIKCEGMANAYKEETIGSKFEAVHTGKSVLKFGARKRDSQVEDPQMRSITAELNTSEQEAKFNNGTGENM